ncbi:MAG: hypothetical protein LBK44_01250 [Spirochaetales bacterium]|jgi:hypothetical protein|nr:hypothetical protein [Spirochaetales bacterium]
MKIFGIVNITLLAISASVFTGCTTLISNTDGDKEEFTYMVGKIIASGKDLNSQDTGRKSGIEIVMRNKLKGTVYTLRSNDNGMFMGVFYNIEEGMYEIQEVGIKSGIPASDDTAAEYIKKKFPGHGILFHISRRRVNNFGEIVWVFDADGEEPRLEFNRNYQKVKEYFDPKIDISNTYWIQVTTHEFRDIEYDVVPGEAAPKYGQREQPGIHGIWNFGNLGLGGYRNSVDKFSAASWSLLNIYIEDRETRLGMRLSPFHYYIFESEYDELTGVFLKDDSNLSLLNIDLYWNPFLRIDSYGIFGPFMSINYLTFNDNPGNFFTHFVFSTGLKFMLKMKPSNIGDPVFSWLEDYSLQIINIDAGYRYINTDHYVYFDVSLDLVTVVWFFWKLSGFAASDDDSGDTYIPERERPHR